MAGGRAPRPRVRPAAGARPRAGGRGRDHMRLTSAPLAARRAAAAAAALCRRSTADQEGSAGRRHLAVALAGARTRLVDLAVDRARSRPCRHRAAPRVGRVGAAARRRRTAPGARRTARCYRRASPWPATGSELSSPAAAPGDRRRPASSDAERARRGFFRRLRENLSKTPPGALAPRSRRRCSTQLDEETWERLEEALITADVGARTTAAVVERLEREATRPASWPAASALTARLVELLAELAPADPEAPRIDLRHTPTVMLMVVGSTAPARRRRSASSPGTCASSSGARVVIGAADTFRAAAVEQLEQWAAARRLRPSSAAPPDADPGVGRLRRDRRGRAARRRRGHRRHRRAPAHAGRADGRAGQGGARDRQAARRARRTRRC